MIDSNLKKYLKEHDALIRKYRLLPNRYTGQVVLIITDGVSRNALQGPKPQPIRLP
jgi:hypothetical protein